MVIIERRIVNYLFSVVLVLFVSTNSIAQRPIVAKENANVTIHSSGSNNGSIEYPNNDYLNTGYVKIHNYRNNDWSSGHNIGLVRNEPYWIVGQFRPNFSNSTDRARAFNLFYAYYSMYIRFATDSLTSANQGFFQYSYYEEDDSLRAVNSDTLSFSSGDTMRYVVRMDTSSFPDTIRGMTIWISNMETPKTVKNQNVALRDTFDVDTKQFREFYIGSGSHGQMYDLPDSSDSFWGFIDNTKIGQGRLEDSSAVNWLEEKTTPSGTVLFEQSEFASGNHETLIPLFEWQEDTPDSGTLGFDGQQNAWQGFHNVLSTTVSSTTVDTFNYSVRYYPSSDIEEEDREKKYISFTALTPAPNDFHFYVRVQGNDMDNSEKYLQFSPAYSGDPVEAGSYIKIPISLSKSTWGTFNEDMLYYFNHYNSDISFEIPDTATVVEVKWFVSRGHNYLGDILLTNDSSILSKTTIPRSEFLPVGERPIEFEILQNYPNPFNPSTTIEFSLKEESYVVLRVYNIQGQAIRELVNGLRFAGKHSIIWDAKDGFGRHVASGTYVLSLERGREKMTRKVTILR